MVKEMPQAVAHCFECIRRKKYVFVIGMMPGSCIPLEVHTRAQHPHGGLRKAKDIPHTRDTRAYVLVTENTVRIQLGERSETRFWNNAQVIKRQWERGLHALP